MPKSRVSLQATVFGNFTASDLKSLTSTPWPYSHSLENFKVQSDFWIQNFI